MATKEEIREGLARRIHYGGDWSCDWEEATETQRARAYASVDFTFAYLDRMGVGIKKNRKAVGLELLDDCVTAWERLI